MTNHVAITHNTLKEAGYTPVTNFKATAKMASVPVLDIELPYVTQYMSVAFSKTTQQGNENYVLTGIQSLTPNNNLFLHPNGQWLFGYQPAFYRSHPFSLQRGATPGQLQLSIQEDHITYELTEDTPRFFDNEKLTDDMQKMVTFLTETFRSRVSTAALVKSLQEAGLIVPWPIGITEMGANNTQQTKTLQGLYHIDAEALNALPAEQLATLNASGALKLAFAQLLSESRINDLTRLQLAQQKHNVQEGDQPISDPDLDDLFGNNDDLLSF